MFAIRHLVIGLLIAHLLWAISYVFGSLFVRRDAENDTRARALMRVVLSSACGFALIGFEGFFLGMAGELNKYGLIAATAINFVALAIVYKESPLSKSFWLWRVQQLRSAFHAGALVVYALFLALSTQAVPPDTTADATNYHLLYAYEWFRHGRIFVDPFVISPYYANNWLVCYAWMFVLGAGRYINFLNWLTGALEGLAVYSIVAMTDDVRRAAAPRLGKLAGYIVYFFCVVSLAASATFLRWSDTSMVDVPLAFYFTATAGAVVYWLLSRSRSAAAGIVVCASFLIGMKESFFVFIPIFAFAGLMLSRVGRANAKYTVLSAGAWLVLAVPWYVRNFIVVGDPIPPVLNLALRGYDPIYSLKDWHGGLQDLATDRSWQALVTFPYRIFAHTLSHDFRDYGVTMAVFGLYAIALFATYMLLKRRKSVADIALVSLCLFVLFGTAYVFATSSLARYALLFYGVLAAANGALLLHVARSNRILIACCVAVSLLTAVPSGTAWPYLGSYYDNNYRYRTELPPDGEYLRRLPPYGQTKVLFNQPALIKPGSSRVLLVGTAMGYYYALHGIETFGGWIGPGRIDRLIASIDNGVVAQYVEEYNVGAVVLNTKAELSEAEQRYFIAQLRDSGFHKIGNSDTNFVLLIRPSMPNLFSNG